MNESIKQQGLKCAHGIAEWLCSVQYPHLDYHTSAGSFSAIIRPDGTEGIATNWMMAFAGMGLLSAFKAFNCSRYESAALRMGNYLKSLQIFNPFQPEHYGAIRELTPQTPWCYTRDALSVAWSFLEFYRHTGEKEYLERAKLWGEWFLAHGLDEDGWPYWGHQFSPYFEGREVQMSNNLQGSFQGGCLNFLYQMNKVTGDKKWTGDVFIRMSDFFVNYIQQDSGFFSHIERKTKKPPISDPQHGLHKANDDLGTLGLLCAYKVTGNKKYLTAIEKFMNAVFVGQREDGGFEDSVACIPVVLNTIHEAGNLIHVSTMQPQAIEQALMQLFDRQSDGNDIPRMRGGIIETSDGYVCARSSNYALILLLKMFTNSKNYLCI